MRRDRAGWIVMAVAIALATLTWLVALEHDRRAAELRLRHAADALVRTISERLDGFEFALRASAALFEASERVEPEEWRRFVSGLDAVDVVPGLLGLGFARQVPSDEVPDYLRSRHADAPSEDPPDTTDPPARSPGPHVLIELIEPRSGPNRRVLGHDLAADPVRRAAIDVARTSGRPALSGPVRLLQDAGDAHAPAGVLLLLAVGREPAAARGAPIPDPVGFVYGPMRVGELMRDVLPRDVPGLSFELLDTAADGTSTRLHASPVDGDAVRRTERTLELPGRRWTLRIAGSDAFEVAARGREPFWVAAAGAAMCMALLGYLRNEARLRRRAADEARRLADETEGRRGAEQAMRDSERRFREVVEASPTGLLMTDASGRIELANPQAERLFGYAPGELLGRDVETLLPDALQVAHRAERAGYLLAPVRRPMGPGRDLRGRRRDGTELPLEIGLSPIGEAGCGRVLAAIVDLSLRQASQRQLEEALREKTLLLDEVHHRVKNNLQVIVSLLSLQARGAPPEARAALGETRNRVHAMALTHQLLHENGDVARLKVGEYLSRLARLLSDGQRGRSPPVSLTVEGADAPLTLELPRAIPCGLLVNELVGDAYRRARPDGPGAIVIGIARDGADARVWVADDGLPPPDDDGAEVAPTLGAQLVPLLVDQLGGTLVQVPGEARRTEVRFPVIAEGGRN
jgi:PAS domain S-box-containing protein